MQLLANCITDMQSKGIDQWGDFYPTEEIIRQDIENETLYLLEIESELAGMVTINEQQDIQWSQAQWLTDNSRSLIVHRLMVAPVYQGQGYGREIMEWVESFAKSHDYTSIRLDAYQGNSAALALYENHEYTKTGQVSFPHRTLPFNCYEKALPHNTPKTNTQWRIIYQAINSCDEVVDVLKAYDFTVQVFCDPQCNEEYMPGLQHRGYRLPLTLFIAVHKDQYQDALHMLQEWQR